MEASFKREGSVAMGDDRSLSKPFAATGRCLPLTSALLVHWKRGRYLTLGRRMEFKTKLPGGPIYSEKHLYAFVESVARSPFFFSNTCQPPTHPTISHKKAFPQKFYTFGGMLFI